MSELTTEKRGRGRPISFDRAELLESVMNRFWEYGYERVSFNELAKESGLTRASLYNSFDSKENLFLEALELYISRSPYQILFDVKPGDKVGSAFNKMFDQISNLVGSDEKHRGCMTANCINELIQHNSPVAEKVREIFASHKGQIRKLIQQAVDQQELASSTDVPVTSDVFATFLWGTSVYAKSGANESDLRQLFNGFMTQVGFQRYDA